MGSRLKGGTVPQQLPRSAVLIALVCGLGCGPIMMLPGGEISGTQSSVPADWTFSNAVKTVQLETRPGDPYSVTVWGVGVGSEFFIAASSTENRWAQNILADPLVRLKVGERIFEMHAERTQAREHIDVFLAAVKKKYDWEPDPGQESEAAIFRLTSR